MTRRTIVFAAGIAVVALFGIGAYLYSSMKAEDHSPGSVTQNTPLVRPHSPVIGNPDAPVTIVEFFDPACESCRAFYPYVKDIMNSYDGKVRLVLRYANFHPQSGDAIRLLEAARNQGKFVAVLERLLATQARWAPHGRDGDSVWSTLPGTGLDIEQAKRDALLPAVAEVMAQDAADVVAAGVKGTPTFYVNGKRLKIFGPEGLADLVRSEVEAN
ncbi:MAG: thioredoxin domain-containing protein [Alphaproteobacteria bacterium]